VIRPSPSWRITTERRLGAEAERVGFLPRAGRGLGRPIDHGRSRGNVSPAPIEHLAGGRERLLHDRADLGLEPRANHHHAVFVVIHVQQPVAVAQPGLLRFGLAVHAAPAADNALDVLGGAGTADLQQPLFGFSRRNPRERPDLRVRQLTARERFL
jgi:hypothetical protein